MPPDIGMVTLAAANGASRFLSRFQSQEAAIRLAEFITSVGAQP